MENTVPLDWGEASEAFEEIEKYVAGNDLSGANEAQTRFDVIDRLIRDVLGWRHGQIRVEENSSGQKPGYVDYILRCADYVIIIEAKKIGGTFPNPTRKRKLKLSGAVLGQGQIGQAITQAKEYGELKAANLVVVTNGPCWCYFSMQDLDNDSYASLLFPFEATGHAELLFETFSVNNVENGSLEIVSNRKPVLENRLITTIKRVDGRVDRNQIADYLNPALNRALYAEALLVDQESLEKCYVNTEARRKFDSQLHLHLAETKPETVAPVERIKRGKNQGPLEGSHPKSCWWVLAQGSTPLEWTKYGRSNPQPSQANSVASVGCRYSPQCATF